MFPERLNMFLPRFRLRILAISSCVRFELPFPLGVVSLYLFEVQQSCSSSSSVILTHAALKWLHSFVPSLDCNPLDSDFCRNIIESAKRQRSQPIVKKKPITTEIIRNILDVHNKEDSNLKDLRISFRRFSSV